MGFVIPMLSYLPSYVPQFLSSRTTAQQNSQPTMVITTAATANDHSEQTAIEHNTCSK
jgi:hypothetical protein